MLFILSPQIKYKLLLVGLDLVYVSIPPGQLLAHSRCSKKSFWNKYDLEIIYVYKRHKVKMLFLWSQFGKK